MVLGGVGSRRGNGNKLEPGTAGEVASLERPHTNVSWVGRGGGQKLLVLSGHTPERREAASNGLICCMQS